jgi:hypothetical protein
MTLVASQGNDATLTADATAAGCQRLQQQWLWQKQWEDNEGEDLHKYYRQWQ